MPSRKCKVNADDAVVARVSSRYTVRGLVQTKVYGAPPSSPAVSSPEKSPRKKRKVNEDDHWNLDMPIDPPILDPLVIPHSKVSMRTPSSKQYNHLCPSDSELLYTGVRGEEGHVPATSSHA